MRVIQGTALTERRPTPIEDAYAHFRLDRQGLPVSPATLRLYEHTIGRFLRWLRTEHPEARRFEELDVLFLGQYRAELAARPGLRGKPIQPETLSGSDRALRTFFRWAAERALSSARSRSRWKPSPAQPALVVLVDELAELSGHGMALFERLARLGRALAIILIAVTQRPSATTLRSLDARTQLTVRVCLGVIEARDTELILGQSRLSAGWRAERLSGPGYCLVLVPGQHETPRPARTYLLTDDAVRATAGRYVLVRPSLDITVSSCVQRLPKSGVPAAKSAHRAEHRASAHPTGRCR